MLDKHVELHFLLADFFELAGQVRRLRKLGEDGQKKLMATMCLQGGPFPWHASQSPVLRLVNYAEANEAASELSCALQRGELSAVLERYDILQESVQQLIRQRRDDEKLRSFFERHGSTIRHTVGQEWLEV